MSEESWSAMWKLGGACELMGLKVLYEEDGSVRIYKPLYHYECAEQAVIGLSTLKQQELAIIEEIKKEDSMNSCFTHEMVDDLLDKLEEAGAPYSQKVAAILETLVVLCQHGGLVKKEIFDLISEAY